MKLETRGVYPNWVDDRDIITQVLNEVIRKSGRMHYSYIINPETQKRMKLILARMRKEKLLLDPINENDFIEMDIQGGWAAKVGYRRYKRLKRWIVLKNKLHIVYNIFFVLALATLFGIFAYLIFSHIK